MRQRLLWALPCALASFQFCVVNVHRKLATGDIDVDHVIIF